MNKKKMLLIRLDRNTQDHLKMVSKDFGMDYTNTIRVLINNEYRFIAEHKTLDEIMKEGK